ERDARDGGGKSEGVAAQLEPGKGTAQRKASPPEPRAGGLHRAILTSTSWLLRFATRFASAGSRAMRAFTTRRSDAASGRIGTAGEERRIGATSVTVPVSAPGNAWLVIVAAAPIRTRRMSVS